MKNKKLDWMSAKVYLLGTVHPLPIQLTTKNMEGLQELLSDMEVIVLESPISEMTPETKKKNPFLYIELLFLKKTIRCIEWFLDFILKEGKGDTESLFLFISKKVKRGISTVELEKLKPKQNSDSSLINIVPCHDSNINADMRNKDRSSNLSSYLNSGLAGRDDVVVKYCNKIIAKKYGKILTFYGNDHTDDLNKRLRASGIDTKIIETRIPHLPF